MNPPLNQIDPGWEDSVPTVTTQIPFPNSDELNEYVNYQLPQQQQVVIPFRVKKTSETIIDKGLRIYNGVDDPQMIIGFNVVGSTSGSITVLLSNIPDSNNYYIRGYAGVIS